MPAWESYRCNPCKTRISPGNSSDEKLSIAPVFSGGLGLAYPIRSDFLFVLEGGSNISTSDFLEGYTNLNYSTSRDMYHSMLLKFIYKLPVHIINIISLNIMKHINIKYGFP